MDISKLDSEKLYYSFVSGAQEVIKNKNNLNEINVFPVADGDTGSNLSSTMHAIILEAKISGSVKETMSSIADAALTGARGNSGIIIAQYINGIFLSLMDEEMITIPSFAETVKKAVPYAYQAISDPVEGTIITVIREWADAVYSHRDLSATFSELFSKSLVTANKSLEATTSRLKVLQDSRVVDSGAKGFVYFLQGFATFLRTGKVDLEVSDDPVDLAFNEELIHSQGEIHHRYCTEALLSGDAIDLEALKAELALYGDSLIVAGNDHKARIHIHANAPEQVFQVLRKKGVILQQKADDMVRQNESAFDRKYATALITDSIADIPQTMLDRYQVHMLPLNLNFDNTSYLDKVTMTPELFYPLLEEAIEYPKSSQPNPSVVEKYLETVLSHYDEVIILTVAKEQSGTNSVFQNAVSKKLHEGKKIAVIDSKRNSGAEGLLVMKAAEMIAAETPFDDVVSTIERLRDRTNIFVSVNNLKYMVRSGRLSKVSGMAAMSINLKPVVSIDAKGKGSIAEKAFSEKGNEKKLFRLLEKVNEQQKVSRYAIVHANNPEKAEAYRKRSVALFGKEPEYIMNISTIVGMSAGVGTVAISYMCEEES
ncbi:DAK2 domain-containing protein [Trichococcus shcherbakoviae]|uniref:DegV family EDD domain-containing protein n=1 Tax=Trichococcus shcherbakoviae subsp. psychrophilus TaxID=2585775 RepID=A0A5C5E9A4_9LACT|nr:DegV family protein [Trichococcus shcherbakoviae]TNV69213.1 DegV family EDD domain-containing protein [Trichococcus shcherbakoviae subsp. psychrophilus]